MTGPRTVALTDRYRLLDGLVHLTGIQALARLPLEQARLDARAGRNTATFISGYEGSPLSGYDLELARHIDLLREHNVVFQPGLNEELAATSVAGSQLAASVEGFRYDGVVGIWYGKAPGLDRASDALRHANLAGTSPLGGALAVVGDDGGAKSSSVPSSSEPALADLGMPTLSPGDSQEVLELGLHGVALSRASGLWVGLKIATAVADGACTVRVTPDLVNPSQPDIEIDGRPYRHTVTGFLLPPWLASLERDLYRARMEIARRYARLNGLNRITRSAPDARIGIVAAGKSYLDLRQALRALGLDDAEPAARGIRLLKVGMVWPLEPEITREFAAGLREIVVVEEKRAFLETQLKEVLYGVPGAPAVHGKTGPDGRPLLALDGELDVDVIAAALAGRLAAHGDFPSVRAWRERRRPPGGRSRPPLPLLTRTPYFCSGCPHNTSTKPPEGSLIGGGIGCHAMVLLMDPGQVGDVLGLTQMGGEGTQWIGMAPFVDSAHLVQNIGDGTFHHSGSLAVRAAVAAGVSITYRLLHNSAVAMTGGQRAVGALSVPDLTRLLTTEGVRRVIVTTDDPKRYGKADFPVGTEVWHRDRIDEAQRVLAGVEGVTVLIHDQECAAEKRRKRKRGTLPAPPTRVVINERLCEGCGDCAWKSNCLSVQPVQTEFGRKTRIHQSSCNVDYSCLEGDCPSFLVVRPGRGGPRRPQAPDIAADEQPTPPRIVGDEDFAMRITGVGGTGVVTVAQVLATAALIAGRHVRALDQTGMAQKGGAVVSDLKISAAPREAAGKLAAGEADLYLGCDLLVAADPKNLAVAHPGRTVTVASTAQVPTGEMVVNPDVGFPDPDGVLDRLRAAGRAAESVFVDAGALSEELLGDSQYANMLLVGAAYQAGAIPLPVEAIEEAIGLNGAAVEANRQAFRWGRQTVASPEALAETRARLRSPGPGTPPPPPEGVGRILRLVAAEPDSELTRLVAIRVPDLAGYADARYAADYAGVVERVRAREAALLPGSTALAEVVARNLYRLMAYKDEYEVARLALDPAVAADITTRFGPGASYSWKLHPPILRTLGMRRKITLGPWFRPAYRVLRGMRRLRGTVFDPFGHAAVRRVERALITEYRDVVDRLLDELTAGNHPAAVEIAELPELVRGYEHVKLGNVDRYRLRLAELLSAFARTGPPAEP
ncbi:indolepyruvate ferredoxin oxidoreductase family protein [Streptosporangium sp. NPDC004631]